MSMRGNDDQLQDGMFSYVSLEERIPATHPLRGVRKLADAGTLVCRCEDVSHGRLAAHGDWRSAKLHTRVGMGACQGRVCSAACETLFGWEPPAPRPPLAPVGVGVLAGAGRGEERE